MYVPVVRPDIVVVAVIPVRFPGLIVQLPEGNPLNKTLPVKVVHVGCIIVLTAGADGIGSTVIVLIFE